MKVKSLFIKDYNQFKDFELDLTYPKGHPKEGKPLDKVCIIGQSGTGKTTLLRFLQEMTDLDNRYFDGNKVPQELPPIFKYGDQSEIILRKQDTSIQLEVTLHERMKGIRYGEAIYNFPTEHGEYLHDRNYGGWTFYLDEKKIKNVFIPADIIFRYNEIFENLTNNIKIKELNSVDFSIIHLGNLKKWLSYDSKQFQETLLQKRNEFAKLATNPKTTANKLAEEVQKLREWEEKQENPLKKLGEDFLNKILNKFQVRVKTEVDFEDIGFIKLETLQGKPVAGDIWSTGTKQVILTALPLYALKPENSVILFDEPERSLYPDIQTQIIEFYTSLGKDCQFFFATHSPIIASSFEPWEIVELKFNEEGNVYREKYFDGENHVDNYFINPQYLKWDSILTKVFDLDMDSNPERIKKLMELAQIRSKIKKMNGSATLEEKQELMKKFEKLANLLDWEFDEKN